MEKIYTEETESLCPVCLKRVKARRVTQNNDVFMTKECEDHGSFKTIIWRGEPSMEKWRRPKTPVRSYLFYGTVERGCPFDCGLCEVHEQLPCSVLLEVTNRCNLHCAVCFADSGHRREEDLSLEKIRWLLGRAITAVGPSNLQLSGGEPTLRDDLPDIIGAAREIGYSFIQINTNGLRLASDKGYLKRLLAAGLSSVFLQFDGIDDEIYCSLRGRALLNQKLSAVRNCGEIGLGVVLVPTLVRGVNTGSVGAIIKQALQMGPTVRGVHFQPISYFGRFPDQLDDDGRFTLPELMRCLEKQTEGLIKMTDFSPPGCEHAHCSFHATYMRSVQGGLRLLGAGVENSCCPSSFSGGGVRKTVETISRRWTLPEPEKFYGPFPLMGETVCCDTRGRSIALQEEPLDLDVFLQEVTTRSFTISAMAFQDAENIDLERLRGCCISILAHNGRLVPFCAYNLTSRDGKTLYRPQNGGDSR